MNHVSLFLSCTVYDDQLTEVRFRHGDSDITFWSTVNFHYLSQLIDLQTKDTYYFIMMGIGDSTTEELLQQNTELRRMGRSDLLSTPPADLLDASKAPRQSAWRITSKGPVPPEAQRAIEDIHAYYDANRDALIAARAEREAAWAAHEQWLKDNPPQPKNTVVQFFPIRRQKRGHLNRAKPPRPIPSNESAHPFPSSLCRRSRLDWHDLAFRAEHAYR